VRAGVKNVSVAERILRDRCGPRCQTNVAVAPLTTFRVGGSAALFLEPQSDADLDAASVAIADSGVPFVVIGKGSNLLVADAGFDGLVLRLGRGYRWATPDGRRLGAGGAMPLPALAGVALRLALSGLEFGVAIPASLGGAVRMNAGAHGAEMADVLVSIDVYRLGQARREAVDAADAGFAYRRSALPPDAVVVGATASLVASEPAQIHERMEEARAWRRRTQPLAEANCGSVFINPPGDHAARLIDDASLKGTSVGGARVSEKHANFIVVEDGARAADVWALIQLVRRRVLSHTGVDLEPEVRLVGRFERA
jgi:UDP-N-acetylmuramate dehydrogenase